ncbi:MAG: MFS transporter [Cyanobacteriota bacterium]|nr:MFS transporter [Cyanobacteriota bacterium]
MSWQDFSNSSNQWRKNTVLFACCLSMLIVSIDVTIVNLAIPSIREALSASETQLQWVIDIYTLMLASLLLLSGAAGDRFGSRRVFQIGLFGFAVGSLLCSQAATIEVLIAARFLQAVGGSMLNPSALSILSSVFAERAERARALGYWGAVVGIAMAIGPPLGGLLIEFFSWRAAFLINLPICLAAFLLSVLVMPERKSGHGEPFDLPGQCLAMLTLFGLVFSLIEGPHRGWHDPSVLASAGLTLTAFPWFLRRELRHPQPFIDLHAFRSIPFSAATLITMMVFAAWGAFLLMMSLYLQSFRHDSAVQTGLIFLPIALGALVFSPVSGHLVAKHGSRPSLVWSGLLLTSASVLLMGLVQHTPLWLLVLIFTLFGMGFAMTSAPVIATSLSGMPPQRSGAAAGVNSTSKQVGVSLGVALCGVVAGDALRVNSALFLASARMVWLFTGMVGLSVIALGLLSTSAWAKRSVSRFQ